MLFGLPISCLPPTPADKETHALGVLLHYTETPCLRTSVRFATPAGIEVTPRISRRENYRLVPKPMWVSALRWEESWEARAPATPPLPLGRCPLRTTSFTTPLGQAVEARKDWSVW